MSQIAELAVLQRQVQDLEDSLKTIERGLTKKELKLRDEFAMHALQALLPMWDANPTFDLCKRAYAIADTMLRAREEVN